MFSETHSLLRNRTLPSFRHFCEGALPSTHRSLSRSPSEENQLPQCKVSPPLPQISPHLEQFAPQEYCVGNMDLESLGWFNITTDRVQATLKLYEPMTLDEAYHSIWDIDPARPLYGDNPPARKAPPSQHELVVDHKAKERSRRTTQHEFMVEAHTLTPEVAHLLAEKDKQMLELKKSASAKGPGKFEQMISNEYAHICAAIVLQLEHAGRIAAERRANELQRLVQELEQELCRSRLDHVASPRHKITEHAHYQDGSVSPSKRRRGPDIADNVESARKGKSLRLPPSPSPSVASLKPRL